MHRPTTSHRVRHSVRKRVRHALYTLTNAKKVAYVILGHGDVLTMTCQDEYNHGIEKSRGTSNTMKP